MPDSSQQKGQTLKGAYVIDSVTLWVKSARAIFLGERLFNTWHERQFNERSRRESKGPQFGVYPESEQASRTALAQSRKSGTSNADMPGCTDLWALVLFTGSLNDVWNLRHCLN
jgi:hypothetical protein